VRGGKSDSVCSAQRVGPSANVDRGGPKAPIHKGSDVVFRFVCAALEMLGVGAALSVASAKAQTADVPGAKGSTYYELVFTDPWPMGTMNTTGGMTPIMRLTWSRLRVI
jgi:hypothetical protein